jgi:hypothetical protein
MYANTFHHYIYITVSFALDPQFHDLPRTVHQGAYTSVWPVPGDILRKDVRNPSTVYKVTGVNDGAAYAMRRFVGCRLDIKAVRLALRPWAQLWSRTNAYDGKTSAVAHPHIIALRDVFVTNEFGDGGCT